MQAEIPAFLHFLLNREMKHYSNESRFAIPDHVIETKALDRIKANSKPEVLVMILEYLKDRFSEYQEEEILIDAKRLYEVVFGEKNYKYSPHLVGQTIKRQLGIEPEKGVSKYFKVPKTEVDGPESVDSDGVIIPAPLKVNWEVHYGKPFVFPKSEFG